jgi:acetyl-CoA carboxylase biotin carboxyl carrier protein
MLKVQEIRELIKLIDCSTIDEFTFEHEGSKIKMKKNLVGAVHVEQSVKQPAVKELQKSKVIEQPAPQAVAMETVREPETAVVAEKSNLHTISSPMVGTFYESSSPDVDAYVRVGSKVTKDSIVCIVEAMKLFNEIEAEVDGEIVEVLVKSGQLVEFGQPLFLVKPE